MAFLAGFVHLAMAALFGVDEVRTGRPSWWLFILISAPLFGSVICVFAEFLPSQRHSRGARQEIRAVQNFVDPERTVREAEFDYERTPSVANRAQLARALWPRAATRDALQRVFTAHTDARTPDAELLHARARRPARPRRRPMRAS